MKKLITILSISLLTLSLYSQTVKKEYYDYYKTKIMAEYQVNSVGEKHGWFKGYNQEGVLIYEYNYKNNLRNGVNKEYSVYGGRKLAQKETYKAGVLDGPAVYYFDGVEIREKGSYNEGEYHGEWLVIKMLAIDRSAYSDEIKKGTQYLKETFYYDKGKRVYPDGEIKAYYYPSNTLYSVGGYFNGKPTGDHVWYNPDGTVSRQRHFDTAEELELKKQNELKVIDSALVALENEDFLQAEELFKTIKYNDASSAMNFLVQAKKFSEEKNYKASVEYITQAYRRFEDGRIMNYYNTNYKLYITDLDAKVDVLSENLDAEGILVELKKQGDLVGNTDLERYNLIVESTKKSLQEQMEIEKKVFEFYGKYLKDNVVAKETFLLDANGKPIMKDTYPKGKYLYLKSKIVVDQYHMEFWKETDYSRKIQLGNKFIKTIESLNSIPESEWKDLNKQLKKIDDPEQIKAILKI